MKCREENISKNQIWQLFQLFLLKTTFIALMMQIKISKKIDMNSFLLHIINGTIVFVIVYYFHLDYLPNNSGYINFFPFFIVLYLLFAFYFRPKNFSFFNRSRLALLQCTFTLFSLSLIASLYGALPPHNISDWIWFRGLVGCRSTM